LKHKKDIVSYNEIIISNIFLGCFLIGFVPINYKK